MQIRALFLIFIAFSLLKCGTDVDDKKFQLIPTSYSKIDFANSITATDSFNVIDFYYIYNGGGLGIGDFNNDGLQDVYFSGNEVSNRLYLNEGDFKFKDITEVAGVAAEDIWSQGIATVDINHDGWLDIYACASIFPTGEKRKNKLFINNGLNTDGIPTFREEAAQWGIQDQGHSSNAAFFDFDLDGDLDLFILNNFMDRVFPSEFRPAVVDGSSVNSDKLYENTGRNHFSDISEKAGILIEGYSHGISIRDINLDGWPDIYITNDFLPNDILYINNQDGTFSNKVSEYLRHQCFSAMGNDIADINNDGLQEIFSLDMLPEINYRKKTMLLKSNPMNQINYDKFDYDYQFIRNMIHLNMGPDEQGHILYSEIGFLSGIQETDWSWSPLFADFDNDGLKDLIVANGFPGDVTDMDYANYSNRYRRFISRKSELFDTIPEVKIDNYIFKNNGNLTFTKKTEDWGLQARTFSNGAAFTDFDNDGDLDYITNNIDMPATIFRNNTIRNEENESKSNYLRIKLKGPEKNPSGLGAKVIVYRDGQLQFHENSPYRGFMSTMDPVLHFGLDTAKNVDSVLVFWPGNYISKSFRLQTNQEIEISFESAEHAKNDDIKNYLIKSEYNPLFRKGHLNSSIKYKHEEKELFDFNYQQTLPHKLSQYTPGIAVGDINRDGLDDLYIGGNQLQAGVFMIQQTNGHFNTEDRLVIKDDIGAQDMGMLFFDADGDDDEDLYIVSGGVETEPNDGSYLDRLYFNDGNGYFNYAPDALPDLKKSGSCVKAADFDKDGDLDLFVGTRTKPGAYPFSEGSSILTNESGIFKDLTSRICPELEKPEMITDAIWTDFNNDQWVDLITVGEWTSIRFYQNENGALNNISSTALAKEVTGWWNSIAGADIDNDGDTDYICGNLGLNTIFQGNETHPLMIWAKDFDLNGIIDPILVKYNKDEFYQLQPFPVTTRDGMLTQVATLRQRVSTYRAFGQSTIFDLFTEEELESSYHRNANHLQSSVLINDGTGKFEIKPLPTQAQFAPIYGILPQDFNHDENLDLMLVGNDYSIEYMSGRIDAFNGLVLLGQGNGAFKPIRPFESGFAVKGDAKGLVTLFNNEGEQIIISTQNRDSLVVHEYKPPPSLKIISPNDAYWAEIKLKSGAIRKHEFYYGSSFISQSSRKLILTDPVVDMVLY
jgi:hypothetical protein